MTWTAASYVDSELGSSAFTAATLPTLTPTVTTGPTSANASWTPTQWSGSTYTLTHATDSSGTDAATAYSGASSSTTDNGEFATATAVLSHATAVSTAEGYTCALTEAGVYCWGLNAYSQTGAPASPLVINPARVTGLPGVATAISTGYRHACAIVAGAAWCWGNNTSGQLGNTSVSGSTSTPVAVSGMSGKTVTAISAGYQSTCAIASQNAYCWGGNTYGEVGNGTTTKAATATQISLGGGRVDAISTSSDYVAASPSATTCAAVAGSARCWGTGTSGQLGNSTNTTSSTPVAVTSTGVLSGRTVTSVAVSATHACATTDTIVACWGLGTSGQLGNGTVTTSNSPVTVSSITGVPAGGLSASVGYSCAVVSAAAWCWGGSAYPLGTGAGSNQTTPTRVTTTGALAAVSVTALDTGSDHACVVGATSSTSAAAYCWGANSYAQLGAGSTSPSSSSTALKATALTVTGCANGASLLSDGNCSLAPYTTYYWKLQHQLSTWTSPASSWVSATTTDRGAVTPSANATTAGSATLAWSAYTPTGQQAARYVLQRSGSSDGASPTTVYDGGALTTTDTGGIPATSNGITALANGSDYSCALSGSGTVYCWGNNFAGELGNGTSGTGAGNYRTSPTVATVMSGATVTAIAAAQHSVCAVAGGTVYCWGADEKGQLGNGTTTASVSVPTTTATAVGGLLSGKTVTAIAAGYSHVCALTSEPAVYCWGSNSYGQLGNGSTTDSNVPVAVTNGALASGTTAITAGRFHTCAIAGGAAYCWGYGADGELGNNTKAVANSSPVAVTATGALAGKTITAIAGGGDHTCAVASAAAYCWGGNGYGQLGNNDSTLASSAVPVAVASASGSALYGKTITAIAAGYGVTCVAASGATYCWGYNGYGQLGNGTTTDSPAPVAVSTSGGTAALAGKTITLVSSAAEGYHSCASDSSGVYCWGMNTTAQLGNGTVTNSSTPVSTGLSLSGWSCPAGSSLASALTCSLASSTTYYYRVTYYLGAWSGPGSGWVAVTTSAG